MAYGYFNDTLDQAPPEALFMRCVDCDVAWDAKHDVARCWDRYHVWAAELRERDSQP